MRYCNRLWRLNSSCAKNQMSRQLPKGTPHFHPTEGHLEPHGKITEQKNEKAAETSLLSCMAAFSDTDCYRRLICTHIPSVKIRQ